jgi:hypothetical protein
MSDSRGDHRSTENRRLQSRDYLQNSQIKQTNKQTRNANTEYTKSRHWINVWELPAVNCFIGRDENSDRPQTGWHVIGSQQEQKIYIWYYVQINIGIRSDRNIVHLVAYPMATLSYSHGVRQSERKATGLHPLNRNLKLQWLLYVYIYIYIYIYTTCVWQCIRLSDHVTLHFNNNMSAAATWLALQVF